MSFADYIIIIVIATGMVFAVIHIAKQKKHGKSNCCSGDCSSCRNRCNK